MFALAIGISELFLVGYVHNLAIRSASRLISTRKNGMVLVIVPKLLFIYYNLL